MKKDYTNANKRFYDKSPSESKKGRKEKKLRAKALALIYIFNNLKSNPSALTNLKSIPSIGPSIASAIEAPCKWP